jgi:hypothetical protein
MDTPAVLLPTHLVVGRKSRGLIPGYWMNEIFIHEERLHCRGGGGGGKIKNQWAKFFFFLLDY